MKGTHWHVRTEKQRDKLIESIRDQPLGEYGFLCKIETGKITSKQRGSLHLYLRSLATALNDAGYDMTATLKEGAKIEWTEQALKREVWHKVQEALTDKKSSEKLTRAEVSDVYENVNRFIAGRTGVMVAWPSNEPPMI